MHVVSIHFSGGSAVIHWQLMPLINYWWFNGKIHLLSYTLTNCPFGERIIHIVGNRIAQIPTSIDFLLTFRLTHKPLDQIPMTSLNVLTFFCELPENARVSIYMRIFSLHLRLFAQIVSPKWRQSLVNTRLIRNVFRTNYNEQTGILLKWMSGLFYLSTFTK